MTPELILKADMLDILFEHRNKDYGAYELRRQYNIRLQKSLAIIFGMILLLTAGAYWKNKLSPKENVIGGIYKGDSVQITAIDLHKEMKPPVPVPKKIATVRDVTIRIVKQADSTEVPTVDQKADKNIGTQNIAGDPPGDIAQPTGDDHAGDGKTAPQPAAPVEDNSVHERAEFMPEFPGGMPALQRFLSRNLKTPKDDMEPGSKIRVLVRFVVDKDGSITGISVDESGGNDFDNEVIRVMKKMPAWKPGMQNGRNVAVYFKIPVIFQAGDEN